MNDAKLKIRELIIKLSDSGKSCRYISDVIGVGKSTVSFWVSRHKKTGSLLDLPRSGKPTKLKGSLLKVICKDLLHFTIRENKAGVSTKILVDKIEKKLGKKYTMRHARRLLRKMGFSLITPRSHHIKGNKIVRGSFRNELKKNLKRSIWVIQ